MYNYFNLHNNKYIKYHTVVVIKIKNVNLCLFSPLQDQIKNNLKFGSSCILDMVDRETNASVHNNTIR